MAIAMYHDVPWTYFLSRTDALLSRTDALLLDFFPIGVYLLLRVMPTTDDVTEDLRPV